MVRALFRVCFGSHKRMGNNAQSWIRQGKVPDSPGGTHRGPATAVRGQALPGVRGKARRRHARLPCIAGFHPGQQDRDAGRPRRRGGDRGGGQRPGFLPPQGPRRSRDLLRGRRAAPHRRLPLLRPLRRERGHLPLVERQPSGRSVQAETGTARHQGLPALRDPGLPARRGAHRLPGGIRAQRIHRDRTRPGGGDRSRPGVGQDGHLPVAALPRSPAGHPIRLREVRDLPDLEPAPGPSGEHRLRGRHRGPRRREHDRPLPPGGLRGTDSQLQP